MNFFKPKNLNELFEITATIDEKYYFLAGGTDINVQIKHRMIPQNANIIFINELHELQGINETEKQIIFGTLTTFEALIKSDTVKSYLPLLSDNLQNFASPLLQTTATIGGNIANGSPTADIMPLLLILDAKLILANKTGERVICLSDFYSGYKKNDLQKGEIIKSITIEKSAQAESKTYYRKVGARKTLTIAKVSIAALWEIDSLILQKIYLAAGSLNEYARRLPLTEEYLTGKKISEIDDVKLFAIIQQEITPISDLRSDSDYRLQVFNNLMKKIIT